MMIRRSERRHRTLAVATENGQTDIVKALLDAGADANKLSGFRSRTALYYARLCRWKSNSREITRLLRESGAGR